MGVFPKHIWDQIKNTTSQELASALLKDGFEFYSKKSAKRLYLHPDGRRIIVHWHSQQPYGAGLLKALLSDAGWSTTEDLRRVGLV